MAIMLENVSDPISILKNYSSEDNTRNTVLRSEVPVLCKSAPCIVGIDEAGRGPVLGPMVYGICYCVKSNEHLLKDNNCADSKSLTEQKREEIFNLLCNDKESIGWAVDVISPNWISNCMLRRQKYSLNEISHNSAIELIALLQESGVNVEEIYVDTVGPPDKYQAKLMGIFPTLKITVSKKADSLFPIVSAASICAKVIRDVVLKTWIFPKGIRVSDENGWGSGYPGDAVTKNFLHENVDPIFGFPNIVRFSWSTAENVLKENAVPVEWSDDEDGLPTGHRNISSYFSNKQKRHIFFSERNLETVENF